MRGLKRYPRRNYGNYRVGKPAYLYKGKPRSGAHCGAGYLGLLKAIFGRRLNATHHI